MRGEHSKNKRKDKEHEGSSPHARGARSQPPLPGVTGGVIPACAGSTRHCAHISLQAGGHPRMRGEHHPQRHHYPCGWGSSPHARGARFISVADGAGTGGGIPACAGSTAFTRLASPRPWGHPRMRGEHRGVYVCAAFVQGVIPACAGSTSNSTVTIKKLGGHPRMRGEHPCECLRLAPLRGSSPHARGAHPVTPSGQGRMGVIPACAGSTFVRLTHVIRPRGHPRMRGEHVFYLDRPKRPRGSSPHARGALSASYSAICSSGVIPACAGSTLRKH